MTKRVLLIVLFAIPATAQFYKQVNHVSDVPGVAPLQDVALRNPWGLSFSPTGPFWVSNAGSNTSTIYTVNAATGVVSKGSLTVSTPLPSGQLYNPSSDFMISAGGTTAPATFLFAGLNGTIYGWNANVPPPPVSTQSVPGVTGPAPANYTGITMAMRGAERFLFTANPAGGRVDVFDKNLVNVPVPGGFADPNLPAGDVPFNIAVIQGELFVTYIGPVGVVNVFDTHGALLRRFATGGTLHNPWGIAVAPANFGKFSDALLIGNFNGGDPVNGPGSISAFNRGTGAFLGLLQDPDGHTISIDGLWALLFGNGQSGGAADRLFFAAGIQGETHGLFGSLVACKAPALSGMSASPNVLWPPNHQMIPVTVRYEVADECDPAPACTLSVNSNQGEGNGSGNASPDWLVLDAHHLQLRAEREGGDKSGRIYRINITCKDKQGFSSTAATNVTVPHDQGNGNGDGDDDGNGKGKGKDKDKDKDK